MKGLREGVLLVDDHPILRRGIRQLLEFRTNLRVVGEAGTAKEAMTAVRALRPRVIVLDIHLPDGSGLDVLVAVRELGDYHVVMYSMGDQPDVVLTAVRAGALGFVTKVTSPEHLVSAVLAADRGEPYFDPEAQAALRAGADSLLIGAAELTTREREVVALLGQGLNSKQIATRFGISPRTVDTHRTRIMKKLNVHNTAGVVRFAMIHGIRNSTD